MLNIANNYFLKHGVCGIINTTSVNCCHYLLVKQPKVKPKKLLRTCEFKIVYKKFEKDIVFPWTSWFKKKILLQRIWSKNIQSCEMWSFRSQYSSVSQSESTNCWYDLCRAKSNFRRAGEITLIKFIMKVRHIESES